MSVLAATLTTMGALVIIFFLDERIRLNLQDFAAVVMINLGVSLLVALFFVPSLIDKIGLKRRRKSSLTGVKRKCGLSVAVAGIRITGLSVAGKDGWGWQMGRDL